MPVDSGIVSDRRVREAHLKFYRGTRRNALALWFANSGNRATHTSPNPPDPPTIGTRCYAVLYKYRGTRKAVIQGAAASKI